MESRSPISEQLNAAVGEGDMESIRAILSQKDHNGLTDDDILYALCIIGYPGTYERFEHPLEACVTLYEGFSESGKDVTLPSTEKRTGWSPLHSAAWYGRKHIVTWLVLEKGYDVNRQDDRGQTPLSVAAEPLNDGGVDDFHICKLLLENGALPNSVDVRYGTPRTPLNAAVNCRKTDVIRLLLEDYHAVPTQNATYQAINLFDAEILSLLLRHGGRVEYGSHADYSGNLDRRLRPDFEHHDELDNDEYEPQDGDFVPRRTPLNSRFFRRAPNRLLNVCRVLVNHARKNVDDTTAFLLASIVDEDDKNRCKDYIDAGVDKQLALRQAVQDNKELICQWLVELEADPFLVNTNDNWSPFQVAASLDDMTILRYFVNLWKERFSSNTGGKNSEGDSPVHVLFRSPHVSLQAIKLLVEEFEANVSQAASSAASGSLGSALLPFHLAVMSGAKLDVIYYLLRLHPDVLTAETIRTTTP